MVFFIFILNEGLYRGLLIYCCLYKLKEIKYSVFSDGYLAYYEHTENPDKPTRNIGISAPFEIFFDSEIRNL